MGDLPPTSHTPTPPQTAFPKSNMSMLYYGLVIVGMSAIVLTLYNLLILRWCSELTSRDRSHQRVRRSARPTSNKSFHVNYVYSFKYKKDGFVQDEGDECECVVCLSVFEEGEELRQLPKCKHFFHASCIDMWLFSHMDCPLCRSPVEPKVTDLPEHSHEGLVGSDSLV